MLIGLISLSCPESHPDLRDASDLLFLPIAASRKRGRYESFYALSHLGKAGRRSSH